jgi:thiosulfate dehydrogenase
VTAVIAVSLLGAVHALEREWHVDQSRDLEQSKFRHTSEAWAIAFGGKLYDNWMTVLGVEPPAGDHPAYPPGGPNSGAASWRCKECHGWDYKGVDGAYGKGSHYTGIKGVQGAAGLDPIRIEAMILNDDHGYGKGMMPPEAVEKLALFVSRGQVDMDRVIGRANGKAAGNPVRGAALFQTICANCHGLDGRDINFRDEGDPEYVGTVASENPWETLHKIRNGQPGEPMVSLRALSLQDQLDVLFHAQTLAVE